MNKNYILFFIISFFLSLPILNVLANPSLATKLSGRILLQVEKNGEAWYLNPQNQKRYHLGKPNEAFLIMKTFGIGISNEDIKKIPIGLMASTDYDADNDGLTNRLEESIGTDPNKKDSDLDNFDDKEEISNNYDPLSNEALVINNTLIEENLGKIFLQVKRNGEAWYLNPNDKKRYFLGKPNDAFEIMKQFGLGITNENLAKIESDTIKITPNPIKKNQNDNKKKNIVISNKNTYLEVLSDIGDAIRKNNTEKVVSLFIPEMEKRVRHTMNYFDDEGRLALGNILSGATFESADENEAIYKSEVYFSMLGYKVPFFFHVQKQTSGEWLLLSL